MTSKNIILQTISDFASPLQIGYEEYSFLESGSINDAVSGGGRHYNMNLNQGRMMIGGVLWKR